MMAKRSQKIPQLREKTELLKCKWGLLSIIFESCQGIGVRRKLISNGRRRPLNQQIIAKYPRKSVQLTSFDEECQRFQNKVELAPDRKSANCNQEQGCKKKDHLTESQTKKPKASEEIMSIINKITTAEETVVNTVEISRSHSPRNYENDLSGVHQVRMSAKALADRAFIERRLKDQLNSEPKSFSDALEVLSSTKSFNSCKKDLEPFKVRAKEDSLQNPSFTTARSDDDTLVLKPKTPKNPKYVENEEFRKTKKRFKHRHKGQSPFRTCRDSYLLPQNGSSVSCANRKIKDELYKRPNLKHKAGDKGFDVILEAKRHLSLRLQSSSAFEGNATRKKRPPRTRTLGRVLLSPERDFGQLSPKRESGIFSWTRYGACNSPTQASNIGFEKQRGILIPSTDDPKVVTTNSDPRQESNGSQSQDEGHTATENSASGSFSEEEEAFKSTASRINTIADTVKYQEEHQSPVSVLEPIFTDDANSPPSTESPTDKQRKLQPRMLDFEEHFFIEKHDRISCYVQLVLQASRLNWESLSVIESIPEERELVPESLFDELGFPLTDNCYFDPKLLFDRINEVLLDSYEAYRFSPGIRGAALDELVIDKVMKESEFYVLERTERRALDELVSEDVMRRCASWLDLRRDTDRILTEISDDVLEELILDVLVGI